MSWQSITQHECQVIVGRLHERMSRRIESSVEELLLSSEEMTELRQRSLSKGPQIARLSVTRGRRLLALVLRSRVEMASTRQKRRCQGTGSPAAHDSGGESTLSRRSLIAAGVSIAADIVVGPAILRRRWLLAEGIEVSTRAVDLVRESTVVDMLGLLTFDWPKLYGWQDHPERFREEDFRQLEVPGIDIFHPAVETNARQPRQAAMTWLRGWRRLTAGQPCFLREIDSTQSLLLAPKLGAIGIVLGFQNSTHFERPSDVQAFFDLGQRVSQLTYNTSNGLGAGCFAREDHGLTARGIDVVSEMNRVGMAIDISHCGERTSLDAIAASRQPVLVTHANPRSLVPRQPRCKSDAVIRRLARAGGVMGLTMVRAFVGHGRPTLDDLIDHFDYVSRLVGVEHVGIGSDLDDRAIDPRNGLALPSYSIAGLLPEARIFQIADRLLQRGYGDREVALVLGENFRRALAAIWPDSSWAPVEERLTHRDPFCPAPKPVEPAAGVAVSGGSGSSVEGPE